MQSVTTDNLDIISRIQWWALAQNDVVGVVDRFHFEGLLALLGHHPDVAAHGPRLVHSVVASQLPQLPVGCRSEVLHNDEPLGAHLCGEGRVGPLVLEDSHPDVGRCELDNHRWWWLIDSLRESPSSVDLCDGSAHLGEGQKVTFLLCSSENWFEDSVIDTGRQPSLRVRAGDVEETQSIEPPILVTLVGMLLEELHLREEGFDGDLLHRGLGPSTFTLTDREAIS